MMSKKAFYEIGKFLLILFLYTLFIIPFVYIFVLIIDSNSFRKIGKFLIEILPVLIMAGIFIVNAKYEDKKRK